MQRLEVLRGRLNSRLLRTPNPTHPVRSNWVSRARRWRGRHGRRCGVGGAGHAARRAREAAAEHVATRDEDSLILPASSSGVATCAFRRSSRRRKWTSWRLSSSGWSQTGAGCGEGSDDEKTEENSKLTRCTTFTTLGGLDGTRNPPLGDALGKMIKGRSLAPLRTVTSRCLDAYQAPRLATRSRVSHCTVQKCCECGKGSNVRANLQYQTNRSMRMRTCVCGIALIHLDDTYHENGEIRFLDGSHRKG